MLILKVGKEQVKCPNSWKELTLKQWVQMVERMSDLGLIKKEGEEGEDKKNEEVKKAEQELVYIKAVRELFAYLINKDIEYVNKINSKDMSVIIDAVSVFFKEKNQSNEIDRFEIKGKTYHFPEIKMEHSTFEDYIEASQLELTNKNLKAGKYAVIGEQMAILCRERGEMFDEQKIQKKKKIFENLKMDIVWDFVFFLNKQINTLKKSLEMFLKEK